MPVYMFDKKGNFHVLTVEQVSFLFFSLPLRRYETLYCWATCPPIVDAGLVVLTRWQLIPLAQYILS